MFNELLASGVNWTPEHIAEVAHQGQYRKFCGEPYVEHPRRVAEAAANDYATPGTALWDEVHAVGMLHDVLEDTEFTAAHLLMLGVPANVVNSVKVLTRGEETYGQYLDRVILSGDKVALAVKLADLRDNLRDLPLGNSLHSRYEAALRRLGAIA
jgi:(p)ppGpp synthase/HD superfamily hydrolase